MKRYIFLLLSLAYSAFSLAQTKASAVYKIIGKDTLALDIYRPVKETNSNPVIVFFHGGGLVGGDRDKLKSQCLFFADKGFVAVTASYRLLSKEAEPSPELVNNCIVDALDAVKWVYKHAAYYKIDTSRVILSGGSAGGFLATVLGWNTSLVDSFAKKGDPVVRARALVLFNPAYSPGTKYAPDVFSYVNKAKVPAVFFYGDQDQFAKAGEEVIGLTKKNGLAIQFWQAKDKGHGFFNQPDWGLLCNQHALNFLVDQQVIDLPKIVIASEKSLTAR